MYPSASLRRVVRPTRAHLLPHVLAAALCAFGACSAEEGPSIDSFTGQSTDDAGAGSPDPMNGGNGGGGGSGGGGGGSMDPGDLLPHGECAAIRRDAPEGRGGVDVIFLLDTSGSMLHATTQVVGNLARFVQEFEGTKADTRVVMITGSDPAAGSSVAADASRYRFVRSEVDSKSLFQTALLTYPQYQDFLRPNAATHFVMITDDNDRTDPSAFRQQMEQLLGRPFTQHAIASESVNGLPCISEAQLWNPLCVAPIPAICAAAAVGERYYSLAGQTGGQTMSICKEDWTEVFDQLRNAVIDAVPLPCDYALADATGEEVQDLDPEKVSIVYKRADGTENVFPRASTPAACADELGWFYDDPVAPATISLCPKACEAVQKGGAIDLAFGCAPPIVL